VTRTALKIQEPEVKVTTQALIANAFANKIISPAGAVKNFVKDIQLGNRKSTERLMEPVRTSSRIQRDKEEGPKESNKTEIRDFQPDIIRTTPKVGGLKIEASGKVQTGKTSAAKMTPKNPISYQNKENTQETEKAKTSKKIEAEEAGKRRRTQQERANSRKQR